MPSTYVKKNGVATRLVGIPKGWNVVNTFNVASTAWVANPDSTTSSTYPYVATISTTYFTDDSQPIWQMNGVGTLPTSTEREAINLVLDAIFTSTGVTLYATDQPTVDLVLETGGFATSYASGTAAAQDVTYSNTTSGLTATDVQAAIDELATHIPKYTADGLSVDSNRVSINSGGYFIDNGFVYVNITLTTLTSVAEPQGLVVGFPEAAQSASSPGYITPVFNGLSMFHITGQTRTGIVARSSIGSGTSVTFITSYQMAQY